MESFGENDQAAMVVGPKGEIEGIWQVLDFYIVLLRIYPPVQRLIPRKNLAYQEN